MPLPAEFLETLAQCAVAYAGLSALSLVVVQLAGVKWQSQMTTGFWLVIAWSLGAFMFSLLPMVVFHFTNSSDYSLSFSSFFLAIYVFVVITSALRRDTRILRLGVTGTARPPVFTMITVGAACYLTSGLLIANAFSLLPLSGLAWYVGALFEILVFGIIPLLHLVSAVHKRE